MTGDTICPKCSSMYVTRTIDCDISHCLCGRCGATFAEREVKRDEPAESVVERLRKLNSDYKQQIHTLRKRCESITRECEELRQTITDRTDIAARLVAEKDALRAELAAIKATVPYRVENVNPGVSVDASPVVRHFDMTKPEPESEE